MGCACLKVCRWMGQMHSGLRANGLWPRLILIDPPSPPKVPTLLWDTARSADTPGLSGSLPLDGHRLGEECPRLSSAGSLSPFQVETPSVWIWRLTPLSAR
jgi:hypothetical protein